MTSASRTIRIGQSSADSSHAMWGGLEYSWLPAQPDDDLVYSLNVTARMDAGDVIDSVWVSMAPSNPPYAEAIGLSFSIAYLGIPTASVDDPPWPVEAQPLSVSALGKVVAVRIAGGVPGRESVVKVIVKTAAGDRFEVPVGFRISTDLETFPRPLVKIPDFSEPIYWEAHTLNFRVSSDSMYLSVL